jgi:hypothetical protein
METLIQFPDPNLADEQGVVALGMGAIKVNEI